MINFQFVSEGLSDDTFQVLQFDAEEEVSQLFHVELRLVSRVPDIDFDGMLKNAACLSIIPEEGRQRKIHGMLAEFEQGRKLPNGLYEYRALLVPRLWMLSQTTQNQIFQGHNVLDIVKNELASHSLATNNDLDLPSPFVPIFKTPEYVVQYKETDLNFISRLMEHEGLYYYFERSENDDCEKLVIMDALAHEDISGTVDDSEVRFQSRVSGTDSLHRLVFKLSRMQKQIPSEVRVEDFNYDTNSAELMQAVQAVGDIDEPGIGFVTEFGAHSKTEDEGIALATVRAEEFMCRQNTYSGESNISDFSCGHTYSLSEHFRSDYNQSYMLTKVKHQGSQEIESWGNPSNTKYSNQFDCIPALLQFRPQRLAVKPRLFGIMNGVIDSEENTGRADLDELGRYLVKMRFDISGVGDGLASRRIRMAQPYGGISDSSEGTGMSFPLLKGTEVILTCIDGDIDRPIITGVVSTPLQPSVTNTLNANSNVIKTSSGITMEFHDGPGDGVIAPMPNFFLDVPYEAAPPKRSYLRLGGKPIGSADETGGIKLYTDGDYVLKSKGKTSTITGDTSYLYGMSKSYSYTMSNDFTSKVGISGLVKTGMSVGTNVGISANMTLGCNFSFGVGSTYTFVKDDAVTVSKEQIADVDERFWAKLDPPDNATPGTLEDTMENQVPAIAAGLAISSSHASVAISSLAEIMQTGADGNDAVNVLANMHAESVYAAGATLSALALQYATSKEANLDTPLAELDLNKDGKYAKLQIQHASAETKMHLRATTEYDAGENASYMKLINKPAKAIVNIKAANTESGSIDLEGGAAGEGKITLTVGNSSITIKDDGIVFECDEKTFTFEATGLTMSDGKLTITKGDIETDDGGITINGGDVKALDGEVKANTCEFSEGKMGSFKGS